MKPTRQIDVNGKHIKVFDNIFANHERMYMYEFLVHSAYYVQRSSFAIPERSSVHKTLKCDFSLKDILSFKFFKNKSILEYIKTNNLRIERCYTNLCTASDIYQYHVDTDTETCPTGLYYANIEWDPTWEGETHFSDDSMTDIIFSSSFTPGRLVIFDGTIPHKSSQPAPSAEYYRFVFTIKFANEKSSGWGNSLTIQDFMFDDTIELSNKEKICIEYIKQKTKNVLHSDTTLYNHLINTFYILKSLQQPEEVCLAGLFHSIYGTEFFKNPTIVDKLDVINLIGEESNKLVELFSLPERDSLILHNMFNEDPKINFKLLNILYANTIEQSYRVPVNWEFVTAIRNKIQNNK